MKSIDITKLSKKQLIKHFEQERQEYLKKGMNEAHIFYIHFGYLNENGRGGDYRVWLDEQKHIRSNHKYCPGSIISMENVDSEGIWIQDNFDELNKVEIRIDFVRSLSKLTDIQRHCVVEVCINERTLSDVAKECERHTSTIAEAVSTGKKKIKNFFS